MGISAYAHSVGGSLVFVTSNNTRTHSVGRFFEYVKLEREDAEARFI